MLVVMLQAAEKSQLADKTKADTARQLLAVVDSFEMAKGQLKPESEGEQKIDGAYQVSCTPSGRPGFLRDALTMYSYTSAVHARKGKHQSECSDRAHPEPIGHRSYCFMTTARYSSCRAWLLPDNCRQLYIPGPHC